MEQIPVGYLEPTTSVIEDAIEALFNIQNGVTTLDVRDYLRNKNYWVSCSNVRPVLRAYVPRDPADTITTIRDSTDTFTMYLLNKGVNVSTPVTLASPFSGLLEYEVTALGSLWSKKYRVYHRNEARYQFAQEFKVPYTETRARRIVHV